MRQYEQNKPIENILKAKLMLEMVKKDYVACIAELESKLESKTKEAAKCLIVELRKNTEEFSTWSGDECAGDELTPEAEENVEKIIRQKFEQLINKWESENQIIQDALTSLMKRLKKYSERLEFNIRAVEDVITKETVSSPEERLNTAGKVALGLTSPIWFPLALIGGIVSLPVLGGMMVKSLIKKANAKKLFKNDKRSYIAERSRQFFESHVSEDGLRSFIAPKFEIVRYNLIQMKSNFLKLIDADMYLILQILDQDIALTKAAEFYAPIKADCDTTRGQLSIFTLKEITATEIDIADIQWGGDTIGSGTFADVFKGNLKINDEKRVDVAVKICKDMLTENNAHDLLSEDLVLRYRKNFLNNILQLLNDV
jgi:DNA-binding protein H-NS